MGCGSGTGFMVAQYFQLPSHYFGMTADALIDVAA